MPTSETVNDLRSPRDAPFCWLSKPALQKIRESLSDEHTISTALCVYLALSEIASDEGSEEFKTTQLWISMRCGLSLRTVQSRLTDLSQLGLVQITTTALKTPSTYRLIRSSCDTQPLHNDTQPLRSDMQNPGQNSLPTYKEKERTIKKEIRTGTQAQDALPLGLPPPETPKSKRHGTLEEIREFCKTLDLPESDADAFFYGKEGNGWKNGRNPVHDWKATIRNWKINGFFPSQKLKTPYGSQPKPTPSDTRNSVIVSGSDADWQRKVDAFNRSQSPNP